MGITEMARDVGCGFRFDPRYNSEDYVLSEAQLERFAALVRENDAERIAILEQDNANCRKAVSDLMDELNKREKQQEPVAWMEDSIEFYAKDHPTNSCTIPLYIAPPATAQAARQMRDAAVKVLREQARKEKNWHKQELLRQMANYIDITLPVPSCASNASLEVQWREIVDDDVLEVMRKVSPATHPQLFARAVIAKFKEVNNV